jgi:metal-responsive CopG/Arc/MetJ family transcriptional regulator
MTGKTISLYLPDNVIEEFDNYLAAVDRTRSDVLRSLVERMLMKERRKK